MLSLENFPGGSTYRLLNTYFSVRIGARKIRRVMVKMIFRAVSKLSIKTSLITPDLNDGFSILALINLNANEDLVSFHQFW